LYHISDEAYEYFTYASAQHFSPVSISGKACFICCLNWLQKNDLQLVKPLISEFKVAVTQAVLLT